MTAASIPSQLLHAVQEAKAAVERVPRRDVSRATGIAKRLTAARLGVRPENAAKRFTITQDGRAETWTTPRPSVYCFRGSVTRLGQDLGVPIGDAARQHPRYFSRLP